MSLVHNDKASIPSLVYAVFFYSELAMCGHRYKLHKLLLMISISLSVALVCGVLYRGLGPSSASVQPIQRDTPGEHLTVMQKPRQKPSKTQGK